MQQLERRVASYTSLDDACSSAIEILAACWVLGLFSEESGIEIALADQSPLRRFGEQVDGRESKFLLNLQAYVT